MPLESLSNRILTCILGGRFLFWPRFENTTAAGQREYSCRERSTLSSFLQPLDLNEHIF